MSDFSSFRPTRRQFVLGATTLVAGSTFTGYGQASQSSMQPTLQGNQFDLGIGYMPINLTGKDRIATGVNGSVPAPTLCWKEGETVSLRVKNNLAHDSSIHWHGIILPSNMDGVRGLSFDGIEPGDTYHYEFQLNQNGTYWYHSHSGFQEQTGVYGATHAQRAMWNQMRMSDRDISDITGYTYTFLMNGQAPASGWTGLFKKGERVLLRIINAAAMTLFDVRIPGLKMTVVASDGQYIEPVTVDEFRIGVAETYDVLVEPSAEVAYTVFAQSIDRTGFARGTLTPNIGLTAPAPEVDDQIILSHADMGMTMAGMDHGSMQGMDHSSMKAMDHSNIPGMSHSATQKTDHTKHGSISTFGSGLAGFGTSSAVVHQPSEFGPQVDMRSDAPRNLLADPGIGLRDHQERFDRRV